MFFVSKKKLQQEVKRQMQLERMDSINTFKDYYVKPLFDVWAKQEAKKNDKARAENTDFTKKVIEHNDLVAGWLKEVKDFMMEKK